MNTLVDKFDYELPKELIALYPAEMRDKCRLMQVDVQNNLITHHIFSDIYDMLDNDTFLVVNNTKVRNARLYAKKITGGQSEVFITNIIDTTHFHGLVRGSFKSGDNLLVDDYKFKLLEKDNEGIWLIESENDIEEIMDKSGHVPLPPYIERQDNKQDYNDYQTVYAKYKTSCAAPTAGLHFTEELLEKIKSKEIEVLEITLDVGIGTFRPVKTKYMEDHIMHKERFYISPDMAEKINQLKLQGKKLTAIGSTSVRALEIMEI